MIEYRRTITLKGAKYAVRTRMKSEFKSEIYEYNRRSFEGGELHPSMFPFYKEIHENEELAKIRHEYICKHIAEFV